MKKVIVTACLLTASLLFGAADRNEGPKSIEFAGYAALPGARLFVIFDAATKESSPWMRIGEGWHGYTVRAFEPKTEKLTVHQGSTDLTLGLQPSKIVDAFLAPRLVRGTYSVIDGRIVYSPDAQLNIGEGILISADTGNAMTSGADRNTVFGDLVVQTPKATFTAIGAAVVVKEGTFTMTASAVRMPPIATEDAKETNQQAAPAASNPNALP